MFRHPEYFLALFGLIPLILLFWFNYLRGRRDLKRLLGSWRRGVHVEVYTVKWFFSTLALVLSLVLIVFAAADPERRGRPEIRSLEARDVVFAVDISRSMLAEDSLPSRLGRSIDIMRSVVASRGGTGRFALVVFRGTGTRLIPITEDLTLFETVFENLGPGVMSGAGTDLADGLATAIDTFPGGVESERLLFLFTDGENFGGQIAASVERARKQGIRIIAIGAGTRTPVTIPRQEGGVLLDGSGQPVRTRLYDENLRYLARETDGLYLSLNDPALMRRLDELFGSERRYTEATESAYQIYLLGAVGALALYFLLRVVRWKDTF